MCGGRGRPQLVAVLVRDILVPMIFGQEDPGWTMTSTVQWGAHVLAFVDASETDPIRLGRAYYLAADPTVAKPHVLLRVHDQVLALHRLFWPDEVRSPRRSGAARGRRRTAPRTDDGHLADRDHVGGLRPRRAA